MFATVAFAAFDITDSSYRNLQAQLGINEAFVTLHLPHMFGPRGGLSWNVGAFANGYGAAGQYDTGKYDTYLFGATHAAGDTLSAFYDLHPAFTLRVEHGVGIGSGFLGYAHLDSKDPAREAGALETIHVVHVSSKDPNFTGGENKLKYGAAFSVYSPKVTLCTSYISHEEIQLQYRTIATATG